MNQIIGAPETAEPKDWRNAIVEIVGKFCVATEHNFRAMFTDATSKQPFPENGDFTLNVFCDGLTGVYTHLVTTFVGDSPTVEEMTVKAVRTKFAQLRADKLRSKIMAANAPGRPGLIQQ